VTPGTVFADRFVVDRAAGSGGMGTVYRAHDRFEGGEVALKVLHGGAQESERFLREARVLAELRHPAIVRYVAHGTTPAGQAWLAMEWLEGEDLADRLARGGLTPSDSVALVARAASALALAHARGVIHRDVKPSNLFLPGGRLQDAKVLDFGIARLAWATRAATRTGVLLGTPGYMAPEQARGEKDVDARADVFSLGSVLFECLTGEPAFVGDNIVAVLAKVLLEDVPHIRDARPDLPAALDELVARLMSKEREARPRTAGEVVEALASVGELRGEEAPRVQRRSISPTGEQRLLCVILVGPRDDRTLADDAPTVVTGEESPALDAARETALAFGARLEPLAGGAAVVALTGTGAATDLAARSARCALALRAVLPQVPIALATGRGDVTARFPAGEAIDRVARLVKDSDRQTTSTVFVDDVTAGLVRDRFHVEGQPGGFSLRGEHGEAGGVRTLLGKKTQCVGRERELGVLAGLFEECATEAMARAVVVTGPPGIGKSRLWHEFAVRASERALAALWVARGDPMSAGSPLGILGRAIRGAAGIQDGEPLSLRRRKLEARVGRRVVGKDRARVAEFLAEMVGAPFEEGASVQLDAARRDAQLMADQMRRAFVDWVGAECGGGPVVLVLEDLHWGDQPTVRFVDAALRTLKDRPLFVLAVGRPEIRDLFPGLWAERDAQEIRVGDLTRRASEKLVREVLGEETDAAVVARVVDRAAGNAFYLEELIRAEAEGKGEGPPATVLAMVQARLEALPAQQRRVLRAASVVGPVFWPGAVAHVLGRDAPGELQADLEELRDREMISSRGEGRFAGEDEHSFRHSTLRDAAYAMLTDEDRPIAHRLAGEWLEVAGETEAGVLAEHFERAGEWARSVPHWLRAAQDALEANDLGEAIGRAQRGLQGAVRAGMEKDLTWGRLRLVQSEAHRWRAEYPEAEAAGLDAFSVVGEGTPDFYATTAALMTATAKLGHRETLIRIAEAVRASTPDAAMRGARLENVARAAVLLSFQGIRDLAKVFFVEVDHLASSPDALAPSVRARVHDAYALRANLAGEPWASLESMEAARGEFEQAGDVRSACGQRVNLGVALTNLGLHERAERSIREALEAAEPLGLQSVVAAGLSNLGTVLHRLGRLAEAREPLQAAIRAYEGQGEVRMGSVSWIYLSEVLLSDGDLESSASAAESALAVCGGLLPLRAQALSCLAASRLAQGRVSEAEQASSDSFAILEKLGSVDDGDARIRLVRVEVLAAAGRKEEAQEALAAARDRLLANARRIEDAALRQSYLERIPDNARTLELASQWLGAP